MPEPRPALLAVLVLAGTIGCQPHLIDEYELARPTGRNEVGQGLLGVRARWDAGAGEAVVTHVHDRTPARRSGIVEGDRVVSVGGTEPISFDHLEEIVRGAPLMSRQEVVIRRGDEEHALELSIVDRGRFRRRHARRVTRSILEEGTEFRIPLLFFYRNLSVDRRIVDEVFGTSREEDVSIYSDVRIVDLLFLHLLRVETTPLFGGWRVTLLTWPLAITRTGSVPRPPENPPERLL